MPVISSFLVRMLCAAYSCDMHYPIPTHAPAISNNLLGDNVRKDPIVVTESGALEGYFGYKVVNGRDVYAFEGIAYAKPPVKSLKFKAPIPIKPWIGIRKAMKPGPDCLQLNPLRLFRTVGREDCLYLNVYTPQIPTDATNPKLPVIIYIHGGNFFFGAGQEFGAAYLLVHDVILVTINYRLGVMGFLSTADDESPGNNGLRDQSLAIKWVYDNIDNFGGDKNKITLSGQSAGAVSTHLHMMSTSNIARGLFSKAIGLSGSAFHHWGLQSPEYARGMTDKLAQVLGCPVNQGSKGLMNCLRQIDANFIVAAQMRLFITTLFPIALFAPVIEPNVTGSFISDTPENYYKNDLVMKIPFLCTNVAEESAFLFWNLDNLGITNYYLRNWRVFEPIVFDYGRYVEYPDVATDIIADVYFGSKNVHKNGLRMDKKIFQEIGSDRYFTVANRKALRAHSQVAATYAYNYHFDSESGTASFTNHDYRDSEATHVDDLASLFNSSLFFKPLERNTKHFEVSKALVNIIVNFADKGEPLHTKEDGSLEKIWDPIINPNDLKFLKIGSDGTFSMVTETLEKARKLKIWDWLGIFK